MKKERAYLIRQLKEAGIHGKIHESMKSLKNCNEVHLGAVLRVGEVIKRFGSKKRYTDQEGRRIQREKLYQRVTTLHVTIGDKNEESVETILERFLIGLHKGFGVDQNWVGIEIGDMDWMEGEDSILKSKVVVEFDITLTGGIYMDTELVQAGIGDLQTRERKGGRDGSDSRGL